MVWTHVLSFFHSVVYGQTFAAFNSILKSESPLKIVTPYVADEFEKSFRNLDLYEEFKDIVVNLRSGFPIGDIPPISKSITPNNHGSARNAPEAIDKYIAEELALGRISGPHTQEQLEKLVGFFWVAPLGTVKKAGDPSKLRIIRDHSFPGDAPCSVNDYIDSDKFLTEWGTFKKFSEFVATCPDGTEAAALDIEAAYRTIPVALGSQKFICIGIHGMFYVEHCLTFGLASAGGVFGRLADGIVAILKGHGITPVFKWVDDFCIIRIPKHPPPTASRKRRKRRNRKRRNRPPSYSYEYDLDSIFSITRPLGVPWHPTKIQDFSPTITYLGWEWDFRARTITLPQQKQDKYLQKVSDFMSNYSEGHSLDDSLSLHGTLIHVCLVYKLGRPHVSRLQHFIRSFHGNKKLFHNANKELRNDLDFWVDKLTNVKIMDIIRPPPSPLPHSIWVSSSDWGIGAIFDGRWEAWKIRDGVSWNDGRRSRKWAEMVAMELGVRLAVAHGVSGDHIEIHTGSSNVINCLERGRSRNFAKNDSIRSITNLIFEHDIHLSPILVSTTENIADPISCGKRDKKLGRVAHRIEVPHEYSSFFVNVYKIKKA